MTVKIEFNPQAPRVKRENYASGRPKYIGWNRCATAADDAPTWSIRKYSDASDNEEQTLDNQQWSGRDSVTWAF